MKRSKPLSSKRYEFTLKESKMFAHNWGQMCVCTSGWRTVKVWSFLCGKHRCFNTLDSERCLSLWKWFAPLPTKRDHTLNWKPRISNCMMTHFSIQRCAHTTDYQNNLYLCLLKLYTLLHWKAITDSYTYTLHGETMHKYMKPHTYICVHMHVCM